MCVVEPCVTHSFQQDIEACLSTKSGNVQDFGAFSEMSLAIMICDEVSLPAARKRLLKYQVEGFTP